jgi:ATP-binding cassette, subfamily B, bacterial PglK
MPYEFYLNENTADLGKNVLSEVQQLTNNFLLPLIKIITSGIVTIVIVLLLLYVEFKTTLIAAAVLILLYALIYIYYSGRLKIGGKRRLQENKERYKKASEALSGIKDIKVLGVEIFFIQRFSIHSSEFSRLQSWYQVVGRVTRYLMEIVAFGGIVGLIVFLVARSISTDEIIPLVSFFAFAGYRLMPALQEVFNSATTFKFNKAVLDQVHKDMSTSDLRDQRKDDSDNQAEALKFKKGIRLENVNFSYSKGKKNALKDITIDIPKNKFIAFIGETGSGKTTLIDVLLGLLKPSKGGLYVDDNQIKGEKVKRWQASVGYVPQQIYLSDDTVARNIAFGLPDKMIDMEQVRKVSKMANLDNFIEDELKDGYQTMIGERGIRLSGGQKQRIGIARALYHDPQVLLLDEATSSLDDETEKEVLAAIEDVSKLKTMIVIAHRLTTVKNSDWIYVLKNGRIEKSGNYDEIVVKRKASNNKN